VRAALLKPDTPSATRDWDFVFGAKPNSINFGKCRPVNQEEQQRTKGMEDWVIGISHWIRELNDRMYVASIVAVNYRPPQANLPTLTTVAGSSEVWCFIDKTAG
jgi:hypothetical protein